MPADIITQLKAPKHAVLFRHAKKNPIEYHQAKEYIAVETLRTQCYCNDLIIGRHIRHGYNELYSDLKNNYSNLINSPEQHAFLKNFAYYPLIEEYTPKTWRSDDFTTVTNKDGPFVVRGLYNSMKRFWNRAMFAENKAKAVEIGLELYRHDDLGHRVLYRQYVPLNVFGNGYNGILYSNEWRFFFLRNDIMTYGYYWSEAPITIQDQAYMNQDGIRFVAMIARIISERCNFFTVDIAETIEGDWIVIDVDDGQEQDLRCIEPDVFYRNLALGLKKFL